jgi:apolipoprotein N-acyltransferase
MKILNAVLRMLAAGLSGLLSAQVMPPNQGQWLLLPIGIAGLYVVTAKQTKRFSALLGLAGAIGYFLPLLRWMDVVGTDAWMMVTLLCSFWWILAFTFRPWLESARWPVLSFATVWTAVEILRDTVPWGGFGWGQFGVTAPLSPFNGLAPNVGQIGATWLFIAAGCFLGQLFVVKRRPQWGLRKVVVALSLCAIAFVPLNFGLETSPSATTRLSVVQGGVDHYGLGSFGDIRAVLRHHVGTTIAHKSLIDTTDLVIWPENAADSNPQVDTVAAELMNQAVTAIKPPILLGTIQGQSDGTLHNLSLLWTRNGYQEIYVKRKVVPFGEFMPFRDFVTSITDRAALMPYDFSPGTTPGSIDSNGVHLGVLICFEVADAGLALTDDSNASVWIVHTNNATYQFRGQSEQQLLAGQMRAAETSRPFVISSTSGISAIIDSTGRVVDSIPQTATGVLVGEFDSIRGKTGAMILYPLLRFGIPLAALLLLIGAGRDRRKVTG